MWKFNKWLFLSQCSHNWWSEMGMDVGQRFWFSELIVIEITWGRMGVGGHQCRCCDCPAGPSYSLWQRKQNGSAVRENDSLLRFPHLSKLYHFIHIVVNMKNSERKWEKKEKKHTLSQGSLFHRDSVIWHVAWVCASVSRQKIVPFQRLPSLLGSCVIATFSHFHFINLFITKKNAWIPW